MPSPQLTNNNALPLYQQVEHFLRGQITSGVIGPGEMLPSVKELCLQFGGINHLTVRQAIKNLSEENLVRSIQGRGCFVTEKVAQHGRIAIVLPHLEDTIFIRIAKGAQDVMASRGMRSLILDSRGSEGTESDHIYNLQELPVNGALIFPIANSNIAEQVFKLKMDGFNFVLVDRYFDDIVTPCVVADNYQGGYDSAQHLTKQGRKRVAWIGELNSTAARLRFQGFQAALNDGNVACPSQLIKSIEISSGAPLSYHSAVRVEVTKAVHELLTLEPRIDAIVCCDDPSALAVLEVLKNSGVKVPSEVAVIGFDDIAEASLSEPSLTTIRQPMTEIGREAALMLLERLENKNAPAERKVLPVKLIVRESA